MAKVKFCKYCREHGDMKTIEAYHTNLFSSEYICPTCGNKLIDTVMEREDGTVLNVLFKDQQLIESMIELQKKDLIEYKLKMSEFRKNYEQIQEIERNKERQKPHCPNCNSTFIKPISGLKRGASIAMWGLMSNKINKSYQCMNCKYTW